MLYVCDMLLYVICLLYVMSVICYMSVICLVLGPSSGSSDSVRTVRIYRRVIFGNRTGDTRDHHVPNIYRCMST
jgi:hypothetical protein